MSGPLIDRGFARLREGLVHYRHMAGEGRPLWLVHASPTSSRRLEPLMGELRRAGVVAPIIAPDTLGNGDSAAPGEDQPEIGYFADSIARTMDALGVEVIDLYGSHTGARIACEFAVAHPGRLRRVIFDGIGEYDAEMQATILASYAPEIAPDDYGRQLVWAFNFVRDQALHFPYFLRDPDHRLMTRSVPSAEELHVSAVEVLKALRSYHKPYLAAFRYPTLSRVPLVQAPALLLKADTDLPSLHAAADDIGPRMQDARVQPTWGGERGKAEAMAAFLA
jgi:pimeloyl-ACP methyl ester carboxylesterase